VAIRDLTLQIRDRMMKYARPKGQIGRIIGSVNPLIPAGHGLPVDPDGGSGGDRSQDRGCAPDSDIDNVY
jgi:hypothetical protein